MELEQIVQPLPQPRSFIDYTNFLAQTQSITAQLTGTNSVTLTLPAGYYNLAKSVLSFQLQFAAGVAANYHVTYSDCFAFLDQLKVSCDGQNLLYIPKFTQYSKMTNVFQERHKDKKFINSYYFQRKSPYTGIQFSSGAANADDSSRINTYQIPDIVPLYLKVPTAFANDTVIQNIQKTDLAKADNYYQQFNNMDESTNSAGEILIQIQLCQLAPFSILESEGLWVRDSLTFEFTFQGTQAFSFLLAPNLTAHNTSIQMTSTVQTQTATISQIQIVAARYRGPISKEQIPKTMLFHYPFLNYANRANDTIRLHGQSISQKLDQQLLSFFNGAPASPEFQYNNSNFDYNNNDEDLISQLSIQIDSINFLQNSSPTDLQYNAVFHFNKHPSIQMNNDVWQYYNHIWSFNYCKDAEGFLGKDLTTQDTSISWNGTFDTVPLYVLVNIGTKIIEYDDQMNMRTIDKKLKNEILLDQISSIENGIRYYLQQYLEEYLKFQNMNKLDLDSYSRQSKQDFHLKQMKNFQKQIEEQKLLLESMKNQITE